MIVETIALGRINPAPYNPRLDLKPGQPEFEKLQRSVEEFGLVEPLVWNQRSGYLVGGHQRLKVLKARGATKAPVVVVDLPPEREKALNLSLNKVQGGWEEPRLAALLQELTETPDFDLRMTGFEADEAEDLIAGLLEEDDEEEAFDPVAAMQSAGPVVTQPGDLILLGHDPARQHRLLCGDATDPVQVRRLMADERAVLFATDPPYLVGYTGTNHPPRKPSCARSGGRTSREPSAAGGGDWSDSYGLTWDDESANPELYRKFIAAAVGEALREDAAWYCWHASRRQGMVEQAWNEAGAFVHCQIIWAKNRGVMTRTWYLWQHEPCFMGWLKGHPPPRRDEQRLSTLWEIDTLPNGDARPDHPTPKPLEVFERPMRQHTRPGEVCYEPFAGSGTQFIAAQRLGRRCFGLEISPRYCDVIVRRFIAMAGEKAVDPEVAERYRIPERMESKGGVS